MFTNKVKPHEAYVCRWLLVQVNPYNILGLQVKDDEPPGRNLCEALTKVRDSTSTTVATREGCQGFRGLLRVQCW